MSERYNGFGEIPIYEYKPDGPPPPGWKNAEPPKNLESHSHNLILKLLSMRA